MDTKALATHYRVHKKALRVWLLLMSSVLSLLFLSGCEAGHVRPAADPTPDVKIKGQLEDAPAGCTPEQVAGRLQELFSAINSADPDLVSEYFGTFEGEEFVAQRGKYFQWYCMDGDDIYDLPDLEQYFAVRFTQNEELRLVRVDINEWNQARDLVDFSVIGERRADDLAGSWYGIHGKGAYNCEYQTFQLLCMGAIP